MSKYSHPNVPTPEPFEGVGLPSEVGGMKTEEGQVHWGIGAINGPALKSAPGGGYMQSSVSNTLLGASLSKRGMKT